MVAKPTAYLRKTLKIEGFETKLSGSNIRKAIRRSTGLCINSELWTGIPDYCRFTTALDSANFERALACIVQFKKLVLGV
ncbi:methionine S-methyltransferase [Iris pallida]|uniref:Methionine S-methyltransferase n=1 Tax=Iris pallida TaxID=29817 RepID=A0AAX6H725_IRIPA|nr:methionine S-methyltransferase [Iris pallida]KAJ6849485.1 methionine S-methyltransferase [Iris pallida]